MGIRNNNSGDNGFGALGVFAVFAAAVVLTSAANQEFDLRIQDRFNEIVNDAVGQWNDNFSGPRNEYL